MIKGRTIIAGTDTPSDHGPATILAAMGVAPLTEDERADLAVRVLFQPSFHPEVCVTIQRLGDDAVVSLVTLQTNLWYWRCDEMQVASGKRAPDDHRPREPERWEEAQAIPHDRLESLVAALAAMNLEPRPDKEYVALDGMSAFCEYQRDHELVVSFEHRPVGTHPPRDGFLREVYGVALELLHDERSVRVLESLHGYMGLGLPVKHMPGRPYVLKIFGSLSASHYVALEASLVQVPGDVPLLLDLSNFDGMGALLYPVFHEFLRRSGPTVCWAIGRPARMQLEDIGVAASALFATRDEALAAVGRGSEDVAPPPGVQGVEHGRRGGGG